MGKPQYYQKVINSLSPLIFVLGVPRFELLWKSSIDCCCVKQDSIISERRRKALWHGALRQLFLNLASNSSGNLEKSVNFQNPQTLAAARTAGCCEWALTQKSAIAFLLLLFQRAGSLLKFAQNRLEIPLWGWVLPSLEGGHTTAHKGKHGGFLCRVLVG